MFRIRFFSIILTALLCQFSVKAQTAEDSVRQVINGMFTAMKDANAIQLQTFFSDSIILQTIVSDKTGGIKIRTDKASEFIDFISHAKAGDADERITFETIKIDGPLAMAWTPYSFYYKGIFSHCGVNSFQLIRTSGGWKIQYLIDTRRKVGCK